MSVQAKASLSIRPRGGQVAVITLICFSAAFLFAAVWFHAQNQNFIIPLCGSIMFLVLGGSFWWVSHKNEELKSSHPFNLNLGEGHNGLALSADVRALPQLDYVKGLLTHYSSVFHREPLPMADGVISESGKPIEGSIEQANKIVLEANEQAREQCDLLMQDLLISAGSPSSTSSPIVSQLPPTIDMVASTSSN